MFEKEIIVDGRGHLVGRLASKIAHQLLVGQKIVVVRCEALVYSGSLFRNNITFHEFLRKANNTNPRRQFKHFRSPSRMFWRVIRGMLPHKTARGKAALQRLKVFEGIPYPYDAKKRMVVPQALKVLRIKSFRNTCVIGDLCNQVGWRNKAIVEKLEQKRLAKSRSTTRPRRRSLQPEPNRWLMVEWARLTTNSRNTDSEHNSLITSDSRLCWTVLRSRLIALVHLHSLTWDDHRN